MRLRVRIREIGSLVTFLFAAKKFRTTRQSVALANLAAKPQHLCSDDITGAVSPLNLVADF
jgi:hypothetical protein